MTAVHTKGNMHYVGNLAMFAEDGIINVIVRNAKPELEFNEITGKAEEKEAQWLRNYTVSQFQRNVEAVWYFANLQNDMLENDKSAAMRDEYRMCKDYYQAAMAVMKDAMEQGNPEDPRVMQDMIKNYNINSKYYKTASIYRK